MGLLGNPNRVQMGLEDRPERSKNEIGLRKEKEILKKMDRNNGWWEMMGEADESV